jgi:hypothetical protein
VKIMLVNGSDVHMLLVLFNAATGYLVESDVHRQINSTGTAIMREKLTAEYLPWLESHDYLSCQEPPDDDETAEPAYAITEAGRGALAELAAYLEAQAKEPPPGVATPIQVGRFKSDNYYCPELRRTSHRPGAFKAFDLPSVINGKVHERKAYNA